jgi:DNA primase
LVSNSLDATSYAALREQLRGLPEESVIETAASELLDRQFDEAEAEGEFDDTLEKLQLGGQKRAFAELQAKAQKFGVSGLSAEEKQAYLQLLSSSSNKG